MIDIHTHLLFGVDDGSKTLEQSLKYLKEIKKIGMNKVVCTPHIQTGNKERVLKIVSNFKVLREEAARLGITLYLGNEILYSENTAELLKTKKIIGINGAKYVLVEFKRNETMRVSQIISFFEELIELGYKPILAHPELYFKYQHISYMRRLKENGVMLQVDATSLFKKTSNRKVAKFTKKMLQEYLIDVVASDSHCTKKRNFKILKKAYKKVKRKNGKKYADIIFNENPLKIIGE